MERAGFTIDERRNAGVRVVGEEPSGDSDSDESSDEDDRYLELPVMFHESD
jgi:hypothetical protein